MHASAHSVPPPDEAAHQDSLLIAELTQVNTQIGRYVLRFLDADAGRADHISTDDERALAVQLAKAADALRARAARRPLHDPPSPLPGRSR
jgi:hypothetical protein